jgi:predicted AlkP superfamily phosphohydrolase/phosphomutase/Tfp pilus assembly protein PilF
MHFPLRPLMATLRSRILLLTLPAVAIGLLLSTVHLPSGQEAYWTSGRRAGQRLAPGWHARWPVIERVARVPRGTIACSGEADEITREGSTRRRAWRVAARVRPQAASVAARALDPGRPCEGVTYRVEAALRSAAASSREAVRAALADMGLEVREAWVGEPAQAPEAPARPAPSPAADGRRILLVGLDGADWQVLDPLIQAGLTPRLARLKREGAWAALRSNTPMLSPLLWTTAATGKPPEEHGIVDFLIRDPRTGARVPISSNFRRTKALWNILTDAGLESDWVAWWATWPAERIRGHMISDRVAYSLFDVRAGEEDEVGAAWPLGLVDEIRERRQEAEGVGIDEVRRFARVDADDLERARRQAGGGTARHGYADPLAHLTRILASTATYHRAALHLLAKGPAPLTAVYYQMIDEVGHRFGHCAPPRLALCSDADFLRYRDTVAAAYRHQDALVGELLDRVPADTVTILLSDHGFQNGEERPADLPPDIEGRPGEWHRAYGIFVIHGSGIAAGRIDTVTLYDIAPTVLHLLGLPAGADMRGSVLAAAREARPAAPAQIASWEETGSQTAPAGDAPASVYDTEVIARLRSLGYIQGGDAEERVEQEPRAAAPEGAAGATYHTNLGALVLNRGEPERAESEFRRALEIRPGHVDAVDGLARALLAQGRSREARQILERLLAGGAAASDRAWPLYAAACREEGRAGDGLAFIDRQPRGARSCLREVARARLLRERRDLSRSEDALSAALVEDPACVDAVDELFDLYGATRQGERQDSLMAAALAARPDSPRLLGLESLRLKARGDLEGAERLLRRALNLAPEDPMLLTNLGSLLGISGRFEQAAAVLRGVVERHPAVIEARINLGAALGKQGRAREAIEVFEEARRMGHASPALLNALALAYAQNRQPHEAVRALERSLSLDRNQPTARALLDDLRNGS